MGNLGDRIQTADWKNEKHVPVIEVPDTIQNGESFPVKVSVGANIPHPNTTEHHIRWIKLYYLPDEAKFPVEIGHFDFSAHGESTAGPNQGPAYAEPSVLCSVRLKTSGTLHALSYCNIHGLWESTRRIGVS